MVGVLRRSRLLSHLACFLLATGPALAQPLPVLHWWQTPAEQAGVHQLQQLAAQRGLRWVNAYPHADAMQRYPALLHRAVQRPSEAVAALVPTYLLPSLQQQGALRPLNAVALAHHWEDVLPPAVAQQLQFDGQWLAAPLSVHALNWMWVNLDVAERLGIRQPPDTWAEWLSMLRKAQQAGIPAIAVGHNPWETALLFELLASGYLGAERFRQVFVQHPPQPELHAQELQPIFERWRTLHAFLTPPAQRQHWISATQQVAQGHALLQVGGNWIEGALHQQPVRFDCWHFPDTQGVVHFNTDALVFLDGHGAAVGQQQDRLAQLLMQPATQTAVNLASGAPPARLDAKAQSLSRCGQRTLQGMRQATVRHTLLPNFLMGTAKHLGLQHVLPALLDDSLRGKIPPADAGHLLVRMLHTAPPP